MMHVIISLFIQRNVLHKVLKKTKDICFVLKTDEWMIWFKTSYISC